MHINAVRDRLSENFFNTKLIAQNIHDLRYILE